MNMTQHEASAVVLTNGVALIVATIKKLSGGETVGTQLDGKSFNDRTLSQFAAARLQLHVVPVAADPENSNAQ